MDPAPATEEPRRCFPKVAKAHIRVTRKHPFLTPDLHPSQHPTATEHNFHVWVGIWSLSFPDSRGLLGTLCSKPQSCSVAFRAMAGPLSRQHWGCLTDNATAQCLDAGTSSRLCVCWWARPLP